MCPTYDNDLAKLQKIYSEPELEWLRLVVDHIIMDTEDKWVEWLF